MVMQLSSSSTPPPYLQWIGRLYGPPVWYSGGPDLYVHNWATVSGDWLVPLSRSLSRSAWYGLGVQGTASLTRPDAAYDLPTSLNVIGHKWQNWSLQRRRCPRGEIASQNPFNPRHSSITSLTHPLDIHKFKGTMQAEYRCVSTNLQPWCTV